MHIHLAYMSNHQTQMESVDFFLVFCGDSGGKSAGFCGVVFFSF